jgi:hypothetical protein
MGWNFGCKEQCSMLLQYQPSTCHLSIHLLGKSIQHLRGNALPWQWHVLDRPPNRKWFGGKLVFQPSTGRSAPVSLMGEVIVKFTHAIARVLERIEVWAWKGGDFWSGRYCFFCRLSLLLFRKGGILI